MLGKELALYLKGEEWVTAREAAERLHPVGGVKVRANRAKQLLILGRIGKLSKRQGDAPKPILFSWREIEDYYDAALPVTPGQMASVCR